MALGGVIGVAGTRWTKAKARAAAEHYAPVRAGQRAARNVGDRLRAARDEGREAMADHERRLRDELGAPRRPGGGAGIG